MSSRLPVLDVTRGILVLGMIVVHALGAWMLREDLGRFPLDLLSSLVAGGFVFLSGFLIGKVLLQKKTGRTLQKQGWRLLFLFLLFNIPLWIYKGIAPYQLLFVPIDPAGRASFEILLPIAYLILLAPLFKRFSSTTLLILSCGGLLFLDVLQYYPYAPKYLLVGIAGLALGRQELRLLPVVALFLFLAFGVILSIHFLWTLVPLALFTLLLLLWPLEQRYLSFLGKHSLFLYIVHIPLVLALSLIDESVSWLVFLLFLIGVTTTSLFLLHLWLLFELRVRKA